MKRRLIILFFVVLMTAGCQAKTKVDVDMHADGSGVVAVQVHLDRQASAAIPDLAKDLRTSDLVAAGWVLDAPKVSNDITAFGVHHSFDGTAQANALMAELTGAGGAFSDFRISRSDHSVKVDTTFSGIADLSKGIDSFGDPALRQRMGHMLGFDSAEAQKSLGIDWQSQFPVEVSVHIPGGSRQSSPATGPDRTWLLRYGQVNTLRASASGVDTRPIVYSVLALACVVGLIVVLWKNRNIYRPQHGGDKDKGISVRDFIDLTSVDEPPANETKSRSSQVAGVP